MHTPSAALQEIAQMWQFVDNDRRRCRSVPRSRQCVALFIGLFATLAIAAPPLPNALDTTTIEWQRLRPLDSDPALDSGMPLQRPCVPGETVVLATAVGADSREQLGLQRGQFVVCIDNLADGSVEVVDGPGKRWRLRRGDVHVTRGFPTEWTALDRDYLVWAYNHDTLIFRESLRGTFEGNFFYLLLDSSTPDAPAVLIDSGTGYADLRPYVMAVIGRRKLYVISTHNHSDHYGGHRHFLGQSNVEFAGYTPGPIYEPYLASQREAIAAFFKLAQWPTQTAEFALGNRRLTIIPAPGHTDDSIAIYDRRDRLLFAGDSAYPGLLFIENWQQCAESMERLQRFAAANPVQWVLGGHIEMSARRPWNDRYQYFHFGSNTHWHEHPLQLPPTALEQIAQLLRTARAGAGDGLPRYDARLIERDFHDLPYQPVSLLGIARHYRDDNDRLLNALKIRHAHFDALRKAAPSR